MAFDVYRIRTGMGLVDYLGQIQAANLSEAEDAARLMFDCDHEIEHFDVTVAD